MAIGKTATPVSVSNIKQLFVTDLEAEMYLRGSKTDTAQVIDGKSTNLTVNSSGVVTISNVQIYKPGIAKLNVGDIVLTVPDYLACTSPVTISGGIFLDWSTGTAATSATFNFEASGTEFRVTGFSKDLSTYYSKGAVIDRINFPSGANSYQSGFSVDNVLDKSLLTISQIKQFLQTK